MKTAFQIGDVRLDRIVELECPIRPAGVFFPGLDPAVLAENRGWMREAGALDGEDWIVLCFQSYVLRTPHHTILVDTCIGNDKPRSVHPRFDQRRDGAYMAALAAGGLTVDDIDIVLCTHLHVDHVGWNTRLEDGHWVPTFPRARYLMSERELAFWGDRHARTPSQHFADSVLPIVAAGRHSVLDPSKPIDDRVRLLPTPGHTPDHVSVLFGAGEDRGVITGDVIHSPLQARYPELEMKDDVDGPAAARTRRAVLERCCATGLLCCGSHFPSPSLARIGRWGDGFRCEPAAA